MKAKFIGDPADGPDVDVPKEFTAYGVTFERGKFSDVPADKAAKFEGNPHYETKPGKEVKEDQVVDDNDLEAKTVPQLKALAEERGVDLGDATKKADIIAALQLAAEA